MPGNGALVNTSNWPKNARKTVAGGGGGRKKIGEVVQWGLRRAVKEGFSHQSVTYIKIPPKHFSNISELVGDIKWESFCVH